MSKEMPIQFSLVAGGPLHSVLSRLGLMGPDGLPGFGTAIVLALLVWLVLVTALVPFLVVLGTQIPSTEIVKWIVGAIL